ncbi:UDP-N-acetylmuramoyl-tripeptide--D-alanyl-D-alanine ligase [uncultured Thermosynechococcus sp.]|uniref:UDP-N-acetylmuramoyl-tripeptide--D-alanyl-D- alanine ligase n=1 Tax=uncultured Thermosynechococcus sp. TaxID=436945 RepID=UPI00261BBCF5|nr:UDP-N-acetylmuramoyl-tripeptide--D-alanyl-D-alanine ligase [uncultured Thermosynechococcus sp.]
MNTTLGAIAHALGVETASPEVPITGVSTDSRQIAAGNLFVALRGATFDGHQFVEQAAAAGAIALIVETAVSSPLPQLRVPDTLWAYQRLGQWWRQQCSAKVIAVTGSVGKTTTKEMIAAVLSHYGAVHKTTANFNNEIGVPKTLLQLEPHHQFAVIEMGMRARGEIALLSRIAQPDVAVITNVGTAHIGRLGSREAIAQAKCELLAEMPAGGTAVLNADSPLLLPTAMQVWSGRTITYGLEGGTLRGRYQPPQTLHVNGRTYTVPLAGAHHALNFLAALGVLQALDLESSCLPPQLMLELPSGRGGRYLLEPDILLLDETYNAGLESMVAALHLLRSLPGRRHLAVLGPMRELGEFSLPFHEQVGATIAELDLDGLLILDRGNEGAALARGAGHVPSQQFACHEELVEYLLKEMQAGDRLLFKASHAVALDRVVTELRQRWPKLPS